MFIKRLFCTLITFPFLSEAHNSGCASVGTAMETTLFNAISRDFKIDTSKILRNKTTIEIIDTTPISKIYAASLAKIDYDSALAQDKSTISESAYFDSYYEKSAHSLTAKYTYINKEMKKDVFIASSLINKEECSVRFNGYITLSREF